MISKVVPAILGFLAVTLLVFWLHGDLSGLQLSKRVPGMDRPPGMASLPAADLKGTFTTGPGTPASLPGAWPRFRGVNLDNIAVERVALARQWGPNGPAKLWTVELGEGYAGAAVLNGRVYVLDYDQSGRRDVLRCLSLADGREIWNRAYKVVVKRNHGMSRTVPAVTDKYVVTIGPKCHVLCADAVTGDFRWGIDLVKEYSTTVPPWYAGQCPLIDGDKAIIAPGGTSLMIAVDLATGKVLWKTPNAHGWPMSHSSIFPLTFAGKRMYVYCASGGVVGVDAASGKLLWETDAWKIGIATVPTPVDVGNGRLFLCGGYNSGAMMLRLQESGGTITATPEFTLKPDVFGSDQQTPIFYQGYIYGVKPGGQLVCLDLQGKQQWASGSEHRFGIGPYMLAGGMLYLLNDTGTLTLVEATPKGYTQLAEAKVLDGHDAWAPLALAGTRLLARDLTRMVCIEVGK